MLATTKFVIDVFGSYEAYSRPSSSHEKGNFCDV